EHHGARLRAARPKSGGRGRAGRWHGGRRGAGPKPLVPRWAGHHPGLRWQRVAWRRVLARAVRAGESLAGRPRRVVRRRRTRGSARTAVARPLARRRGRGRELHRRLVSARPHARYQDADGLAARLLHGRRALERWKVGKLESWTVEPSNRPTVQPSLIL